jgi:hypothetical protein
MVPLMSISISKTFVLIVKKYLFWMSTSSHFAVRHAKGENMYFKKTFGSLFDQQIWVISTKFKSLGT